MSEKIYEDNGKKYLVEYDIDELLRFRENLINEMSIVDHFHTVSIEQPYYSPYRRENHYLIRNDTRTFEDWMDIYHVNISDYDRYTTPYLANIINDLVTGGRNSVKNILNVTIGDEYIPIKETIAEYANLIAEFNSYARKNPDATYGHREEARIARENLQKYIDILLDDQYQYKFVNYYNTVKKMITVKELTEEEKENKPASLKRKRKGQ